MRILQVITELRPGGAERVVADLSAGLVARGHEVRVTALKPLPAASPILTDLAVANVPVSSLNLTAVAPWRLWRLRRALAAWQPDVVHAHLVHANLCSRLASPAPPRPWRLVNTVHICERRPGKQWHFLADRWTYGRCDVQTAVSQAVRDFHAARIRVRPACLPVIYNGIRPPGMLTPEQVLDLRREWGVADCATVLGAVGRLDWQKGFDLLLRLLPDLGRIMPEGERWGLVVLGEGTERAALENLASRSPPAIKVVLPGFRRDAAACIGAFDLFVMPSRYEGFGLTLAEAMCHGVPILASPVDSLPELLAGYPNGRLADFAAPDDAAIAAVLDLIRHDARTPACRFSLDAMVDAYCALYTGQAACGVSGCERACT
jgi:glycosyltransferase involved in cell wall biosynthesis